MELQDFSAQMNGRTAVLVGNLTLNNQALTLQLEAVTGQLMASEAARAKAEEELATLRPAQDGENKPYDPLAESAAPAASVPPPSARMATVEGAK